MAAQNSEPLRHYTDREIVNYARAEYGLAFANAVEQALSSVSLGFSSRVRLSFWREMSDRGGAR